MLKKIMTGFVLLTALVFGMTGCKSADKNTDIVLTTEFAEDEVFRIDNAACFLHEIKIYLRTSQNQYESLFGTEIWEKDIGNTTLGAQLKDTILARLAQIKVMTLLADAHGVSLDESENEKCRSVAKEYMASLSEAEKTDLGATEERVTQMYCEYALANKVYESITKDVNPEISDDEARTIKVKHILFKNYGLDKDGNRKEWEYIDQLRAKARCRKVLEQIQAGADFDEMAEKYNEDDETTYSFMKGTMPEKFEEAAFSLGTDEVAGIIETEYGYHIIKCISTFDQAETDANKQKIVQERKKEVFNAEYTEFVKTVYSNLNEELWGSLNLETNPEVTTVNFFDLFTEE